METNLGNTGPSLILAAILSLAFLPHFLPAAEELRSWTNREGKSVSARFVEFNGNNVVLELENRNRSEVQVTTLSLGDQEYLRLMRDRHPLVWPAALKVEAGSVSVQEGVQKPEGREFHYETKTFRFISNAPFTNRVLSEVATDFELTAAAFETLPWGWVPRSRDGGLFTFHLAETDADFFALGGIDNASGGSKDDYAFVSFSAMGLRKVGSQYSYDASLKEPGRVIGLSARLLTHDMRFLLRPWTSSGLENFLEHVSYTNGTLKFDDLETSLKREIRTRTEGDFVSLDLDRMVTHLHAYWDDYNDGAVQVRREVNLDSLLLFYFFGYLDGDGNGEVLHRYFQEISKEALAWRAYQISPNSAPRPRPSNGGSSQQWSQEFLDILIAGRGDEELKSAINTKFRSIAVRF